MNQELLMTIIAIITFLAVMGILWYTGKKDIVKQIILGLVIDAETYFGSGTGLIKLNFVLSSAYKQLPMLVRFFVTSGMIEGWVDDAVKYIKTQLQKDGTTIEESLKNK